MQKVVIIVVLIIVAAVFIAPRLWKSALHEETGSTRTKLPSFNDYDNSKFPDRDKLLLAAEYLKGIDPNGIYFIEAKERKKKKITQYVNDLDIVLGDIKKDNKTDENLEKFRSEGSTELEEIKTLADAHQLKNLKSIRVLYIVVGDWKLLTQGSTTADKKVSIENKFKELGIKLPI